MVIYNVKYAKIVTVFAVRYSVLWYCGIVALRNYGIVALRDEDIGRCPMLVVAPLWGFFWGNGRSTPN